MVDEKNRTLVRWSDWSNESFERAKEHGKLVLLDLSASWCHWCHVMDSTTYSNPEVAKKINEAFVPVRVDIDQRPDISERYNRGGFPTTAFLSDQGESVWGATYVPPNDMLRIMKSILRAKESGEIDQALERSRMQYLDLSKAIEKRTGTEPGFNESVFEDIFSTYDVQEGGFGVAPKFPHPSVLDMLLVKFAGNGDKELSDAIRHTLDRMYDGIGDPVEGGVFRYSVTRDWKTPHFEKMLETNTGFLRNLVNAYSIIGDERFEERAFSVANYMLATLRDDKSGGFFGSQDADEEYYRMSAEGRRKRTPPSVDRTIYAGWNCEAANAFIQSGYLLRDEGLISAGLRALDHAASRLWNPAMKLVRHQEGEGTYLFEDQVAFLEALLSSLEQAPNEDTEAIIENLLTGVEKSFSNSEGGYSDVIRLKDAIGELGEPRRPLVANSRWSVGIATYGIVTGRPELLVKAREMIDSFPPSEVERHGLFGASYVIASWVLNRGPQVVKIESREEDALEEPLWTEAKAVVDPGTLVLFRPSSRADMATAVVCSRGACSKPFVEPEALAGVLRNSRVCAGDI